jgi:hypothetical protein
LQDIANEKHYTWGAKVFARAQKMALVIGDSERMRSLLHAKQLQAYGKVSVWVQRPSTCSPCACGTPAGMDANSSA